MDGVEERRFSELYERAMDRRGLQDAYSSHFLSSRQTPNLRWFDKTPQNVYGLLLISGMYPEATFIHIHRHPLNVVASLKLGEVMPVHTTLAAINAWLEAVTIVKGYKSAFPDRMLEVSYESLTTDADVTVRRVLKFVDEVWEEGLTSDLALHGEQNKYLSVLSEPDIALIKRVLADQMEFYGYR